MADTLFPHRAPYWFVGDGHRPHGDGISLYGEPFVQLLHLDPATHSVQTFHIATVGTSYEPNADYQPNVHWLDPEDAIAFTDISDFNGSPLRFRNLFVAKVPSQLQLRMDTSAR